MNLANIVPRKFGQYIHKLLFSICDIQCFIIVFLEWCKRSSRICDAHVEKIGKLWGHVRFITCIGVTYVAKLRVVLEHVNPI